MSIRALPDSICSRGQDPAFGASIGATLSRNRSGGGKSAPTYSLSLTKNGVRPSSGPEAWVKVRCAAWTASHCSTVVLPLPARPLMIRRGRSASQASKLSALIFCALAIVRLT